MVSRPPLPCPSKIPSYCAYHTGQVPNSSGWIGSARDAITDLHRPGPRGARPAPGWLGIRFTAHLVAAGTVDETCTLWDSHGHVVAQGTQLARLRFPDEMG